MEEVRMMTPAVSHSTKGDSNMSNHTCVLPFKMFMRGEGG